MVQYLKILSSIFGDEDFQRFTLNLHRSSCGYYYADNASSTNNKYPMFVRE